MGKVMGILAVAVIGIGAGMWYTMYGGRTVIADELIPAPGCTRSNGLTIGGCFNKSKMARFSVNGAPDCVTIEKNDCNGDGIAVKGTCTTQVTMAGTTIPAEGAQYQIVLDATGGAQLTGTAAGRPDSDTYSRDVPVTLNGMADGIKFTVTYTRTHACD